MSNFFTHLPRAIKNTAKMNSSNPFFGKLRFVKINKKELVRRDFVFQLAETPPNIFYFGKFIFLYDTHPKLGNNDSNAVIFIIFEVYVKVKKEKHDQSSRWETRLVKIREDWNWRYAWILVNDDLQKEYLFIFKQAAEIAGLIP